MSASSQDLGVRTLARLSSVARAICARSASPRSVVRLVSSWSERFGISLAKCETPVGRYEQVELKFEHAKMLSEKVSELPRASRRDALESRARGPVAQKDRAAVS